jgi:hypothetical protein
MPPPPPNYELILIRERTEAKLAQLSGPRSFSPFSDSLGWAEKGEERMIFSYLDPRSDGGGGSGCMGGGGSVAHFPPSSPIHHLLCSPESQRTN